MFVHIYISKYLPSKAYTYVTVCVNKNNNELFTKTIFLLVKLNYVLK